MKMILAVAHNPSSQWLLKNHFYVVVLNKISHKKIYSESDERNFPIFSMKTKNDESERLIE